jgi:hypothetical protein
MGPSTFNLKGNSVESNLLEKLICLTGSYVFTSRKKKVLMFSLRCNQTHFVADSYGS